MLTSLYHIKKDYSYQLVGIINVHKEFLPILHAICYNKFKWTRKGVFH